MLTDLQRLARSLDMQLAALPREEWPALVDDARRVIAGQWSGEVDGKPACLDCRRMESYASHACSCPIGKVRKRMRGML